MRGLFWLGLGWLGLVVASALAAHVPWWSHWVPDVPLLLVAYLAMRQGRRRAALLAAALGYLVDTMAGAPVGLHATALVATALLMGTLAGRLGGTGAAHFGLVAATAQFIYHAALMALLWWQGRHVGFVSWPAALLVPAALLAGGMGHVSYALLERLHRRQVRGATEGLSWH